MHFKRKIELGYAFDSVKKLPADVVRQNITNAGGPEASRYLLDLCAPLSSLAGPVKNKTTLAIYSPVETCSTWKNNIPAQ